MHLYVMIATFKFNYFFLFFGAYYFYYFSCLCLFSKICSCVRISRSFFWHFEKDCSRTFWWSERKSKLFSDVSRTVALGNLDRLKKNNVPALSWCFEDKHTLAFYSAHISFFNTSVCRDPFGCYSYTVLGKLQSQLSFSCFFPIFFFPHGLVLSAFIFRRLLLFRGGG